ncbi:MAG: choline-glycine betaine transporter [Arenicella sp.]|jgi:choline-glycine betaine transporter
MKNSNSNTLQIQVDEKGFYTGFNKIVALSSKLIIILIVVWAASNPEVAGKILDDMKNWSFDNLKYYYNWVVGFFISVCLVIAVYPKWGRIKLGSDGAKPEFSNFSWFSMMFGAGIGIGMLGFATGEPITYMDDNPAIRASTLEISSALSQAGISIPQDSSIWEVYRSQVASGTLPDLGITGSVLVEPRTLSTVTTVFRYEFLHWGISAWCCYALVGIALAFFAYRKGQPLTIRSTLTPLFGQHLQGGLGHIVDITAVVATILGISQTIGLGLSTFAAGVFNITGWQWLVTTGVTPEPTLAALLLALAIVMLCSTLSALSGVGKGIKWLSNINMVLSFGLLAFFLVFGSTLFFLSILGAGLVDYLIHLPVLTFYVFPTQEPGSPGEWQAWWSIFYWAWWIAFAPFVGMFLARISKNRTIREFIVGAVLAPSLMCFVWFTLLGGTAIDLELSGAAQGSIYAKTLTAQLFEVINVLLDSWLAIAMSFLIVILLLTYLVTSADSAALVANIISAGGETERAPKSQIIIWGLLITAVIAALLLAGGLGAIQAAMIIGAIPFSFIMLLMGISLLKGLLQEET